MRVGANNEEHDHMPRSWISVPVGHGIRVGRSIADSELRGHLPSYRRHELRHGLQTAAKARGETLTREDADYLIDKALASGLLDSSGDLNFHMRGTREEIIDGMMATAKAWGSPLSQAEAASIADKAIRWQRWRPIEALTLVLLAAICFVLVSS
jgi:hypothetical protein